MHYILLAISLSTGVGASPVYSPAFAFQEFDSQSACAAAREKSEAMIKAFEEPGRSTMVRWYKLECLPKS